tara:strand:- start:914 stop:1270 length:357 start_codon:yes stop_codon:yes gene_type:complete
MAEPGLDPDHLLTAAWMELRTELHQWDDLEEIEGYDCLTRYWCSDAVFEIYWVAEREVDNEYSVYLTEDLQLAGFKTRLNHQPSIEWKRALAVKLGWQQRAKEILRELSGTQMELFKE